MDVTAWGGRGCIQRVLRAESRSSANFRRWKEAEQSSKGDWEEANEVGKKNISRRVINSVSIAENPSKRTELTTGLGKNDVIDSTDFDGLLGIEVWSGLKRIKLRKQRMDWDSSCDEFCWREEMVLQLEKYMEQKWLFLKKKDGKCYIKHFWLPGSALHLFCDGLSN